MSTSTEAVPGMKATLLGNKVTGKVLYLEAEKEFIDLLISLLLIPTGSILKLLMDNNMMETGSRTGIANIYDSILKLNKNYLVSEKEALVNPAANLHMQSEFLPISQGDNSSSNVDKFYRCNRGCLTFFSKVRSSNCPTCGHVGTVIVEIALHPHVAVTTQAPPTVGYVKETVTFLVTDDMAMFPSSAIKALTLLNKSGVGQMQDLESIDVTIGKFEALQIVAAAHTSKTVLNSVFGASFKKAVKAME